MIYATYPARAGMALLPPGTVRALTGESKSEQYRRINDGRHPPPVKTGPRSARTPDYVINDYTACKAAGEKWSTEKYLRALESEQRI